MIGINSVVFKGVRQTDSSKMGKEGKNNRQIPYPKYPNANIDPAIYRQLLYVLRAIDKKKIDTSEMSFAQWAQKNEFLNATLPSLLLNADEYKIGSGFSHKAYKIPENDNYILRTSNSINVNDIDITSGEIIDMEDEDLKINIGQQVANIKLQTKTGHPVFFEVLKKQEGTPIGVTNPRALYDEITGELRPGALPYEAPERKEQYAASLEKLADLPLESYENLINDIQAAFNAGYRLDHFNSNNLLLDEKNKEINLIDMERATGELNYGNILYALTNIQYFKTFISGYPNKVPDCQIGKAINETITIVQKFMLAMKMQGVKFSHINSSLEFQDLLSSYPLAMLAGGFGKDKVYEYFKMNGVA